MAGLPYTTSAGYNGVTDSTGAFRYNTGDTITFKLGSLTLGSATGGPALYPADLARKEGSNAANVATNLMVLLQSLNTTPGTAVITLPASLQSATLPGLDLKQTPASFAAQSDLTQILSTGGIKTPVVAPDTALAAATKVFQESAAGFWQSHDATGKALPVFWRLDAKGQYLMGNANESNNSLNGVEGGTLVWDPLTNTFKGSPITLDANGASGLSNRDAASLAQTFRVTGSTLTISTADGNTVQQLRRVPSQSDTIVGVWAIESATEVKRHHLVFLADGTFALLDPVGANDPGCKVGAGIELSSFTADRATGKVSITGGKVDTNGCAGLGSSSFTITSLSANKMTVRWPEGTTDELLRVTP